MIKSLNLCLTYKCSANCIFCPNDRGECDTTTTGMMDWNTLTKIVEEARDIPELEQIIIGENGDCFLHHDIIRHLRYIHNTFPTKKIVMFTNFLTSTAEQWSEIIRDKLVDHVVCNIDSIDPEQYKLAKNADFFKMWENFTGFILMRAAMHKYNDISLEVNVLDPVVYYNTILKSFDMMPECDYEVSGEDKTTQTINTLKYLLTEKDVVQGVLPCFWAERDKVGGHLENNFCPQLKRVETEAFIAPDGTWYACCLDSKNELRLGNIHTQSLKEIANGHKRKLLIERLKRGHFEKIGSPCNTVVACHSYKQGGEKNE